MRVRCGGTPKGAEGIGRVTMLKELSRAMRTITPQSAEAFRIYGGLRRTVEAVPTPSRGRHPNNLAIPVFFLTCQGLPGPSLDCPGLAWPSLVDFSGPDRLDLAGDMTR